MSTSRSEWYRTLHPDKRKRIDRLHRVNPYWNLVGVLFALSWIATATIMLRADSWAVYLPGYVFVGLLIYGMTNLMHEGIHGTLFRVRWLDNWFGLMMGAPALLPFTSYRISHQLHHRHTRTEHDPNEFANIVENQSLLPAFFYAWLLLGMAVFAVRFPYVALQHATPVERRRIVFEHGILLVMLGAVLAASWWFDYVAAVAHVWLAPLAVASFQGNVRSWAEHTLTVPGNSLTDTRTVTSNRLFSFLSINQNYHLEHHLFPGVPWYNLPKLHRILRDDFTAAGASICHSYTRFLWDALRAGVRGARPAIRNMN